MSISETSVILKVKKIIRRGTRVLRNESLSVFVKKTFSYISNFPLIRIKNWKYKTSLIFMPLIMHRFRRLVKDINNTREAVDFTLSFKYLYVSIQPQQVKEEIVNLLVLVEKLKPRVVLEIGTAKGGTLFLFSRVSDSEATIISVDLPSGKFGGGYSRLKIPLYKSFIKGFQKIYLIRTSSHDPKTLEKVKNILSGKVIDFLFIDGDHSYKGVKRDFEMYSPLVRSGGMVAFHDIVPHDRVHDSSGTCEVARFWNEVKDNYKYLEIVKNLKQGWAGIGVLYV